MPDRNDEVSRRTLASETLRSSRLVGRIRFVGITIALAFNWIFAEVFPAARQYQASVPLFFAYWVAAALVFWAGRRSDRVAGLVGIDIAVLDMPAVFFLQLTQLLRTHISQAGDLVKAAKANDQAVVAKAKDAWYANADDIATFLSQANPSNWPVDEVKAMMHTHLDQTIGEATDRLKGNHTQEIAD